MKDELEIRVHPTLGVRCRSDGAVEVLCTGARYTRKKKWTYGNPRGDYLRVQIMKKSYSVHRLIAEAFCDNQDNKPFVDHKNRIKTDNRSVNLRFCTREENMANMDRVDVSIENYGVRCCDDRKQYCHNYHEANRDKINARHREMYALNKTVS